MALKHPQSPSAHAFSRRPVIRHTSPHRQPTVGKELLPNPGALCLRAPPRLSSIPSYSHALLEQRGERERRISDERVEVSKADWIRLLFPEGTHGIGRAKIRLRMRVLAGVLLGIPFNRHIIIVLKPGDTVRNLIHEWRAELRRKGAQPFPYVGISSTFRLENGRPVPHPHVHIIAALPDASLEWELSQTFLERYTGLTDGYTVDGQPISRKFRAYKRTHRLEPMKRLHIQTIDNTRPLNDGLPGLLRYFEHHIENLAKLRDAGFPRSCPDHLELRVAPLSCREIGTRASQLGQGGLHAADDGGHVLLPRRCLPKALAQSLPLPAVLLPLVQIIAPAAIAPSIEAPALAITVGQRRIRPNEGW